MSERSCASLLLRRFVFRMAEASAKRVTGDEPQGTMGMKRETSGYEADLAPQYLTNKFTKRSNIHTCNTRTRNSLQILLYRTAIGQRTFSYRGANTWNNLHNELRQSASLTSFKRALKDKLLRQTFPS